MHATEKKPAAEVVMTVLHAGGKFDSDTYKVSGGLHGVGVSVVNALSDWLDLEIWRDGDVWEQSYEKGIPTSKLKASGKTRKTGTKITFHADPEIFGKATYSYDTLAQRLRELAFLNKGLKITLDDERSGKKTEFRFTGGIAEFVKHLNKGKGVLHDSPISKASAIRWKWKSRCNITTAMPKMSLPSPTPSTPWTAARTFPASALRSPARSITTRIPSAC
jgi:DNA gyrase subunit B